MTEAQQKIVEENMDIVYMMAGRYTGLEHDDIVQEGCIGLIRAAETYDANKNVQFRTYASKVIHNQILKAIYYQSNTLRIPEHIQRQAQQISNFLNEYYLTNGHEPSQKEISEKLNIPISQINQIRQIRQPISLDIPIDDEESECLKDVVADDTDEMTDAENKIFIGQMLETLTEIERAVISWRYLESRTYREIAERLDMSIDTVKQIEKKTLKKLKNDVKIV